MNRRIQNIAVCFLLICHVASIMNLLFPRVEGRTEKVVKIDVHNDGFPGEGKEEKSERFKTFSAHFTYKSSFDTGVVASHYFEQPGNLFRQIFLPIILPPPKALA